MTIDLSLFRALPEPRGCGKRKAGGMYIESGIGPYGVPLEHFMIDPPLPLPPGLDLVNKPQIWPRSLFTGKPEHDEAGQPIYDLLIHIGASYYPWAPDYIEETRRLGASRRLPVTLNVSRLNRASRMVLAHPKAIPTNWRELSVPDRCEKQMDRHDSVWYAKHYMDSKTDPDRAGPCLFKLWDLLPLDQAAAITEVYPLSIRRLGSSDARMALPSGARNRQHPLCIRCIGSTAYSYQPTGETVDAWAEAFILALPLTGFSLIQYADGSVDGKARDKLQASLAKQGEWHLPTYEVPC